MADAKSGEILAYLRFSNFELDAAEDSVRFDDELSNINLGNARQNAIARDRNH
jgi:hypothetical protein